MAFNLKTSANAVNNDFKITSRNENDLIPTSDYRKPLPMLTDMIRAAPVTSRPHPFARRTPSPPKSRVLSSATNHFNRVNALLAASQPKSTQPSMASSSSSSVTKSCYTGLSSAVDGLRVPGGSSGGSTGRTLDCSGRLKRLEMSGLIQKFHNFKTTSLASEEDDEDDDNDVHIMDHKQMDSAFEPKDNDTIELKSSSEEFEPNFVSQIKTEVRKLSTQPIGSSTQSCSQKQKQSSDGCVPTKRKSSTNGCKSQNSSLNGSNKLAKTTTASVRPAGNLKLVSRKSKSNEDIKGDNCKTRESRGLSRGKSDESLNDKRRSNSSNGRLNGYDKPHKDLNNKVMNNNNMKIASNRCQSQPIVDQKQSININHNNINNNNKINSNVNVNRNEHKSVAKSDSNMSQTDGSNTDRNNDKSIRKIRVNSKSYQILNCIGQGGSSKVYQVYDPEEQRTLAVKIVDLSRADEQTVFGYKNEITLLDKLRSCKRVVRMYDYEYINAGQQLLVVMEKGDSDLNVVLKSFIEDQRSLDTHLIRFYWQQMLKAVDEIHAMGVVHSDLKPVNFILVAGKLKLIDFGIANAIQANYTSVYKESQIGTINYMAPEALQNRSEIRGKTVIKYNCKADVWSLGCILYNLVYNRTPFHHFNNVFQKASAILDPNYLIEYTAIDDHLLLDVMQKCLQRDPNKRPTTKELLNHSYLVTESHTTGAHKDSQNVLISQIHNLTPNRIKQLSQVLEKLTKH